MRLIIKRSEMIVEGASSSMHVREDGVYGSGDLQQPIKGGRYTLKLDPELRSLWLLI